MRNFDDKTFKRLCRYFDSSYFRIPESLQRLHIIIAGFHPDFHKIPDSELLFSQLFGTTYDHEKMHLIISRYYKKIEQFLAHEGIENNTSLAEQVTFHELKKIAPEKIFANKKKALKKFYNKISLRTEDRLYGKVLLEENSFEYYTKLQNPESIKDLQELNDSIDKHFLYLKLKYACELLSRKQILDQNFDLSFLNTILDYGKQNFDKSTPIIYCYFRLVQLIQNSNEEDYWFIRKFIFEEEGQFNKEDLKIIHVFLINFCIRMSNIGKSEYLRELFSVYKDLLDRKIIHHGKGIHLYDFKNITTVAVRLKEYEWAQSFTSEYKNSIPIQFRSSASAYNLARIDFYQGNLKSAIQQLFNVEYSDLYYELGCRTLIIKIYYEMGDFSLFEANCNSFKIFITRLKIASDYQRQIYSNFIKHCRRLFKIKEGNRKNSKKWLEEIQNTKEIADLTWVEEKVKELL